MTLHDDPQLTRYALGEMTDADRAAFEATLGDADRAEVDAIRALGGALAGALSLGNEGTAGAAAIRQAGMPVPRTRSRRTHWMLAAAAAVTIAGIGFTAGVLSTRQTLTPVATNLKQVGQANGLYSNENRFAQVASGASGSKSIVSQDSVAALESLGRATVAIRREVEPTSVSRLESALAAVEASREPMASLRDQGVTVVKPALSPASAAPVAADVRPLPPAAAKPAEPQLRQRVEAAKSKSSAEANGRPKVAHDRNLEYAFFDADGDGIADHGFGIGGFGGGRFENLGKRVTPSTESYAHLPENPFVDPRATPLSTFGVDVDTASYANVRRFLTAGQKPPADAVRVEELINYFPTSDAPPADGKPFAVHAEVARCPWNASHDLVRVALKAKEVAVDKRPTSNLVFLIDVSGSMNEPDKLPLVKRGLGQLVDQLGENDRVAIVVYAGSSGLVLPSTNAADKATIRAAIDRLEAGGSTNGGQGIELAYATAAANFVRGGANRVILCTDGDFNVGVTDRGSLLELIQQKAKAGTFLNVLGFGTGNVKDDTMEMLADKGNGQYAYVDADREAHKVFVEQASGTLVTVAKDVKIQVEFNPQAVASYRLIGYENRVLAKEDFNNDLKDAGEIGAGHNVVALYEIARVGATATSNVDKLKYQAAPSTPAADANAELLTLKLRYKAPDAPLEQGVSQLIEQPLAASDRAIEQASADFQFDAAVAGFGMLLRGSSAKGECDWAMVTRLARAGLGADAGGHRAEFLTLVEKASTLAR